MFKGQNAQTWNINSGVPFDKNAERELFEALGKDWVSGITFTGGDPLHENNTKTILNLINKIRLLFENKTIWLYTGYTIDQCLKNDIRKEIVSKCDVVIDGKFMDKHKDATLKWRGSSNQKIWRNDKETWTDVTNIT